MLISRQTMVQVPRFGNKIEVVAAMPWQLLEGNKETFVIPDAADVDVFLAEQAQAMPQPDTSSIRTLEDELAASQRKLVKNGIETIRKYLVLGDLYLQQFGLVAAPSQKDRSVDGALSAYNQSLTLLNSINRHFVRQDHTETKVLTYLKLGNVYENYKHDEPKGVFHYRSAFNLANKIELSPQSELFQSVVKRLNRFEHEMPAPEKPLIIFD